MLNISMLWDQMSSLTVVGREGRCLRNQMDRYVRWPYRVSQASMQPRSKSVMRDRYTYTSSDGVTQLMQAMRVWLQLLVDRAGNRMWPHWCHYDVSLIDIFAISFVSPLPHAIYISRIISTKWPVRNICRTHIMDRHCCLCSRSHSHDQSYHTRCNMYNDQGRQDRCNHNHCRLALGYRCYYCCHLAWQRYRKRRRMKETR